MGSRKEWMLIFCFFFLITEGIAQEKQDFSLSKLGYIIEVYGISYNYQESFVCYCFIEEDKINNNLTVLHDYCDGGDVALIESIYMNDGYVVADQNTGEITYLCCQYGDERKGVLAVINGNDTIADSLSVVLEKLHNTTIDNLSTAMERYSYSIKYLDKKRNCKTQFKVIKVSLDYCLCNSDFAYSSLGGRKGEILMIKRINLATKLKSKEKRRFKAYFDKIYKCK